MATRTRLGLREPLLDLRRERERDSGHAGDLLNARLADPLQAAESPEERPPAPRSDPRHGIEARHEAGPCAELPVIEVHEAVRLVAHALKEEERGRVRLEHDRVLPP